MLNFYYLTIQITINCECINITILSIYFEKYYKKIKFQQINK